MNKKFKGLFCESLVNYWLNDDFLNLEKVINLILSLFFVNNRNFVSI